MAVHSANSEQVKLLDKEDQYAIHLRAKGVNGRLDPTFRGYSNVRCTGLTPPLKGTVIAKKRSGLLIVFNQDEFKKLCGDKMGVNGQPMLWIYEPLNFVRKDKEDKVEGNSHGDVAAALESIENQKKFTGLAADEKDQAMVPVGYSGGEAAKGPDPDASGEPVDDKYMLAESERFNIKMRSSGVRARLTTDFRGRDNLACKRLKRNMRGTVVARKDGGILIAFNPEDWKKACGDADGVLGQPMAWVYEPGNFVRRDNSETATSYGVTGEAVAAMQDAQVEATSDAGQFADDGLSEAECNTCGAPPDFSGAKDISAALTHGDLDRRCFRSDGTADVATGGFKAILARARSRGWNKACVNELKRIACEESPWKDLGLKDRFNRIMALGKKHAQKYGVDARAMPCIAGAETLSLEPLIKVFHSCYKGIHNNYTAQGMGQMTRTTFRAYFKRGGAGLGPFRSSIPPFNQPPYNQDADKLFDAMGTSVELQLEIMAYTLREKKRGSKDWTMFFATMVFLKATPTRPIDA